MLAFALHISVLLCWVHICIFIIVISSSWIDPWSLCSVLLCLFSQPLFQSLFYLIWVLLLLLSFGLHLHEISFSPSLSVCMCPLFWGGFLVDNTYRGLVFLSIQPVFVFSGSIPRLGRSPGEGKNNTLQFFRLVNPMDRGAWWATAHGVTESQTRLSNWHGHFQVWKRSTSGLALWFMEETLLAQEKCWHRDWNSSQVLSPRDLPGTCCVTRIFHPPSQPAHEGHASISWMRNGGGSDCWKDLSMAVQLVRRAGIQALKEATAALGCGEGWRTEAL